MILPPYFTWFNLFSSFLLSYCLIFLFVYFPPNLQWKIPPVLRHSTHFLVDWYGWIWVYAQLRRDPEEHKQNKIWCDCKFHPSHHQVTSRKTRLPSGCVTIVMPMGWWIYERFSKIVQQMFFILFQSINGERRWNAINPLNVILWEEIYSVGLARDNVQSVYLEHWRQ